MAKNGCVLCGKQLSMLDRLSITVCDTKQTVCIDCDKRWHYAGSEERKALLEQMLQSPDLSEKDYILGYLNAEKGKNCTACGADLELKIRNLSIGADGYGGFTSLGLEQYQVDLFACPKCGKVELYTASFKTEEERAKEGPSTVICPTCGKEHSALIACPTCVMRRANNINASDVFRAREQEKREKKKAFKPPWEK